MAGRGDRRLGLAAAGAALLALPAGCGGPGARHVVTVSVPAASFPARQQLATPATLRIAVRNDGDRALPDVAVSVDSFLTPAGGAGPARSTRPVWIVDRAPGGGAGADTATWALGSLAPGATRTFVWRVTPVAAGRYSVGYSVAAGLAGGPVAELAGGGPPRGSLAVTISRAPGDPRVDPATGRVIRRPRLG